jgi:FAD-dependent oxidoreductase domain-containing protein 1
LAFGDDQGNSADHSIRMRVMQASETADVVIIGGGIMGSATAYALTHAASPPRRIIIIERDLAFREASTPRSAGGVRHQFSTPQNILLSQATLTLLRELNERFGADADPGFREQGYLILASAGGEAVLRQNATTQTAHGGDTRLLDPEGLQRQFPWLATDGVALGSFGAHGEGWLDPVILSALLRKAAVAKGAVLIEDEVAGFDMTQDRIDAVRCKSGRRIAAGDVVNAAGAWSGAVGRLARIALPVEPRKRYIYVVDCREATEALRKGPLTVDPSGVWFRPEGRTFICGVSPDEADEPSAVDLDHIDYAPYDDVVWPALAARVPVFESLKLLSAWAGYYDYNTLDQNAIIGRHPALRNLLVVTGFSGHGLQQGYGAGRGIAELILHGRFESIDLTCFGCERIVEKRPLFELNVI